MFQGLGIRRTFGFSFDINFHPPSSETRVVVIDILVWNVGVFFCAVHTHVYKYFGSADFVAKKAAQGLETFQFERHPSTQ